MSCHRVQKSGSGPIHGNKASHYGERWRTAEKNPQPICLGLQSNVEALWLDQFQALIRTKRFQLNQTERIPMILPWDLDFAYYGVQQLGTNCKNSLGTNGNGSRKRDEIMPWLGNLGFDSKALVLVREVWLSEGPPSLVAMQEPASGNPQ